MSLLLQNRHHQMQNQVTYVQYVKVKVKFSRCRPNQAFGDPEG